MLDFKFPPNLDNGFNNCEDAMISSVVYNESDHYECLHALYWGMEYLPPSPSLESLNDRFYLSGLFRMQNSLLEELFGLTFTKHFDVNRDSFLDNLRCRLDQGRAVVLRMDTFDCPWNVGFQNYHRRHFVIVTGLSAPDTLVCHDPFCKVQSGELELKSLGMQSFDYFNYSFDTPSRRCSHERLLHKMAQAYLEKRYADNIRSLARELRDYDLYSEVCHIPFDSVCLAPFFIQFKGIVSSRLNLIDFVALLPAGLRSVLRPVFEQLAEGWNVAYCVLIKAISRGGARECMEQAAELLLQMADDEQHLAASIVEREEGH